MMVFISLQHEMFAFFKEMQLMSKILNLEGTTVMEACITSL